MADVASSLDSWSTTASSNGPSGSTPVGTGLDDNLREIQAVTRKGLATKGVDIASGATVDLSTATGNRIDVTHSSGTTAITSFGTLTAGMWKIVKFAISGGTLSLTHNATSMKLPRGRNIPLSDGDCIYATSLGSGNWEVDFYESATGAVVGIQKLAKGADVASATALPLISDGNYFDVTGTTTVTSFNSLGVGTWIRLHFDAALTLTHNATDLDLPGDANITTAAGDEAEFIEYASGDWRCVSYTRADGKSLIGALTAGTVLTAPGATFPFTLPSWVTRFTVNAIGLSLSGTDDLLLQLGDAGGLENSGYASSLIIQIASSTNSSAQTSTAGALVPIGSAASTVDVRFVGELLNPATFTWLITISGKYNSNNVFHGVTTKSLSAAIDRLSLIPTGVNTIDLGSANVTYQ